MFFYRDKSRSWDVHFGFDHIGGFDLWDFQPGMRTEHIFNRFSRLISTHPRPHIAIFHCAGNDIGQTRLGLIINSLKSVFIQMIKQYSKYFLFGLASFHVFNTAMKFHTLSLKKIELEFQWMDELPLRKLCI